MRWKKNVNLDHLIRWLGISLGQREGGEPWHEPEARGGRGLSNPPVKHSYTGSPRGLEGLIDESNIYGKMRWKKNVNLEYLIRRAWHLTQPEGRGRAAARARGEGWARPIQHHSKTLIHGRPSRSRGPNLRV